jgi:hypothetical protein
VPKQNSLTYDPFLGSPSIEHFASCSRNLKPRFKHVVAAAAYRSNEGRPRPWAWTALDGVSVSSAVRNDVELPACPECAQLFGRLRSTRTEYREALTSEFFKVSTIVAAKKQVDMERARLAFVEHTLGCRFAIAAPFASQLLVGYAQAT